MGNRSKPNMPKRPWKAVVEYSYGFDHTFRKTVTFSTKQRREKELARWPGIISVERIDPPKQKRERRLLDPNPLKGDEPIPMDYLGSLFLLQVGSENDEIESRFRSLEMRLSAIEASIAQLFGKDER